MSETTGVAIIGGGPAGSTLATLLARRGVEVTIIDRDQFPRDKVCGEFLSYDALPILDALGATTEVDDRAGAPKIDRCRVYTRRGTLEFGFPHPARGVSRLFLDDLLMRIAVRAGAQRLEGWTTTALDAGTVVVEREGVTRRITPRVIVGAWGRWGRIDTQLQRRFVGDRTHRSFGFKRHFFAARQPDAVELYSFSEGYLGVNAVEGGLTNICGLVHANRLAGHRGKWNAFVETIREERPEIDQLFARHEPAQSSYLSSEPVIFRARSPVEQGVFMIGDAAGIIDPLTGNGMAMAMQSALVAASAVLRALEQPARRREIERSYARTHWKLFAGRIRWSRAIASVLSSPETLSWLVGTVGTPGIGSFLVQRTRARRDAIQRLADAFC